LAAGSPGHATERLVGCEDVSIDVTDFEPARIATDHNEQPAGRCPDLVRLLFEGDESPFGRPIQDRPGEITSELALRGESNSDGMLADGLDPDGSFAATEC
jgi:hypothetical protein